MSLPRPNFTLRYESDIPRQIGLAGSSAIITATLRALMAFYGVDVPKEVQPSLILSAERDELDINAGFMDRVIQVYEGCVFMDLDESLLRATGHGRYEPLDPAPPAAALPGLQAGPGQGLGPGPQRDPGQGTTAATPSRSAMLEEARRPGRAGPAGACWRAIGRRSSG